MFISILLGITFVSIMLLKRWNPAQAPHLIDGSVQIHMPGMTFSKCDLQKCKLEEELRHSGPLALL
jgi:hypothetical protein